QFFGARRGQLLAVGAERQRAEDRERLGDRRPFLPRGQVPELHLAVQLLLVVRAPTARGEDLAVRAERHQHHCAPVLPQDPALLPRRHVPQVNILIVRRGQRLQIGTEGRRVTGNESVKGPPLRPGGRVPEPDRSLGGRAQRLAVRAEGQAGNPVALGVRVERPALGPRGQGPHLDGPVAGRAGQVPTVGTERQALNAVAVALERAPFLPRGRVPQLHLAPGGVGLPVVPPAPCGQGLAVGTERQAGGALFVPAPGGEFL